jgi:hypothetical protein
MPTSSGPILPNKENLMFMFQPGSTTLFNNFTSSLAPDVATPTNGAAIGPRRKNDQYTSSYDDRNSVNSYQGIPTLSLQNLNGSLYTLNTANISIYTLSLWVKVVQFPTKYGSTRSYQHQDRPDIVPGTSGLVTKAKRTKLARYDYSYSGTGTQYNGFIEFGAMAPYYKNASGTPNYKSIFTPISFGAAICGAGQQQSVYTNYKFNLNEWYLLTIQLESSSTFAFAIQNLNVKMFVNNSQENIAKCDGIAWSQNHGHVSHYGAYQSVKRKNGGVAAQPGFYNRVTGGTIPNASSQILGGYTTFMDLSRLNCISYSPILQFGNGVSQNVNTNGNLPSLYGNNLVGRGSSINFGQTYIYNTTFNSSLYTQFNSLYS